MSLTSLLDALPRCWRCSAPATSQYPSLGGRLTCDVCSTRNQADQAVDLSWGDALREIQASQKTPTIQETLRNAWIEADRKVDRLSANKPEACPENRDKLFDWRLDFHEAIGYRDGLRAACVVAGVPGFQE